MMDKEYKTHLHVLSFDVTRRCNLNCEWCLKGESENIDITTEIIDKTFDNVSKYLIHGINLFGGEPLLRPDIIIYIIDQIVERKIMVGSLVLFTNGLIRDNDVKLALDKFCQYAKSIEQDFCKISGVPLAYAEKSEKIKVVIGHRFHETSINEVEKAIKFYQENSKMILAVKEEDEPRLEVMLLGGRLKDNYKKYISNPVSFNTVVMNNEECYIIKNFNYSKFYGKNLFDNYIQIVISIASNGNVYPGTRYSYKEMDESPMFNIMECDDFYSSVLEWCWKHPVNSNIRELRKKKMLYEWCQEHNYEICNFSPDEVKEMLALNIIADEQEKRAKKIHSMFPNLKLCQVDLLASLDILISLKKLNTNIKDIRSYIRQCTFFGMDVAVFTIDNLNQYIHLILGEMDGTLTLEETIAIMLQGDEYDKETVIKYIREQGYSIKEAINIYSQMLANKAKGTEYLKSLRRQ